MLWYKTWLESRNRFIYVAGGMIVLTAFMVVSFKSWGVPPQINFRGFVWHALFFRFFHAAWVFSTLFLAMGGLRAETAHGTALFTLSLPVTRVRMLSVRVVVAVAEAVAAAIVPALCLPVFAWAVGQDYPVAQSLEFALLLVAGGLVFLAIGVLLSTVLEGDWPPVGLGIPIVAGIYTITRSTPDLRPYNPQDLFSRAASVHAAAWAVGGPWPWTAIAVSLGIALVLVLMSALISKRLDF